MQSSDANRFRDLLRGMGRMYGAEPDALTLDAYWIALKGWQLPDFEAACAQLMQTAKFMPRPADFTALQNAGRMTAGEAWAQVLDYVRHGYSRNGLPTWGGDPPAPSDPLLLAAVRAVGGWQTLSVIDSDQIPYIERRFAEHFDAISDAEDVREALPQIAGPSRVRVNGPRRLSEIGFDIHNENEPLA